jgi:hypothetical protein
MVIPSINVALQTGSRSHPQQAGSPMTRKFAPSVKKERIKIYLAPNETKVTLIIN